MGGSEWALELGGMRWGLGSSEWASRKVGVFKILGPILGPKKTLMNPSQPPIFNPLPLPGLSGLHLGSSQILISS